LADFLLRASGQAAEPVREKISESICLKLKGHLHKIIVEKGRLPLTWSIRKVNVGQNGSNKGMKPKKKGSSGIKSYIIYISALTLIAFGFSLFYNIF
jgi:hypothetical protein